MNAPYRSVSRVEVLLIISCVLLLVIAVRIGSGVLGLPSSTRQSTSFNSQQFRDLGHTTIRKKWRVVFPVYNASARRLVLHQANTDCNCGKKGRRTFVVFPGTTTDVPVLLDTRFANGSVEAVATFTTSDPGQPIIVLTVQAWVEGNVTLGEVKAEAKQEFSVLVQQ